MAEVKVGSLIYGIDKRKKAEKLIDKRIVDCEGFLYYKKVLRKDWKASSVDITCDYIRSRPMDLLAKCSVDCPEVGSTNEGGSSSGW